MKILTQKSQIEMKNTVFEKGRLFDSITRGQKQPVRIISSENDPLSAASTIKIVSETLIDVIWYK